MALRFDRVWTGARLATMAGPSPLGIVEDAALASVDGRIAYVGAAADLPTGWAAGGVIPLDGPWVTPGLIDCHTHLVYAGNRAAEWEMRLAGESYEAISRAGGGIRSSVAGVRAASES